MLLHSCYVIESNRVVMAIQEWCDRFELKPHDSLVAINWLKDLNTWPKWSSSCTRMLVDRDSGLSVGIKICMHRMIKGALVEEHWECTNLRGDDVHYVVDLEWIAQHRMGKPSAQGLKQWKLNITVLTESEGGIEIHSEWDITRRGKLFKRGYRKMIVQFSSTLLNDLMYAVISKTGDQEE